MLNFHSIKKLRAERDRLKAEISIMSRQDAEQHMDNLIAGKVHGVLSADEIFRPILPLTRKLVEIENLIIERSSKRELLAERSALQLLLDLQLNETTSGYSLSQEARLNIGEINNKIAKLDYAINSKFGFGGTVVRWLKYLQLAFVIAISVGAIISIIFQLFK